MQHYELMSSRDLEMGSGQREFPDHGTQNNTATEANAIKTEYNPLINNEIVKRTYKDTYDSVVYIVVPIDCLDYFKSWLKEYLEAISGFKGFIIRYVHQVERTDLFVEFMIISVFDSFPSFDSWFSSQVRKDKYVLLDKMGIKWSALNAYGGAAIDEDGSVQDNDTQRTKKKLLHRIMDQTSSLKLPKPAPPPKWKLTLMIIPGISLLVLAYIFSGQGISMLAAGLPKGFVVFVFVCELVVMNVYALSHITMDIPGVSQWLRAPRDVDSLNPVLSVLDQGLMIFAAKANNSVSLEQKQWMDMIEGKIERLRKVEHELKQSIRQLEKMSNITESKELPEREKIHQLEHIVSKYEDRTGFAYRGDAEPERISMAIRHFVKWEHVLEFEQWTDAIEAELKNWNGFLGMVKISPRRDGEPYIISFSFDTAEHLLAFTKSKRRQDLLLQLAPMLEATSKAEINEERKINDGFSELFVATGGDAKRRPPPLWKTCVLTIIPLHIIVWQVGGGLDEYLIPTKLSVYIIAIIKLSINITINSYIGVPLMFSLFGEWLHTPRPIREMSCIRFLDRGMPKPYMYILVALYFSSCLLGGLIRGTMA